MHQIRIVPKSDKSRERRTPERVNIKIGDAEEERRTDREEEEETDE
jgi:hypothetical protein